MRCQRSVYIGPYGRHTPTVRVREGATDQSGVQGGRAQGHAAAGMGVRGGAIHSADEYLIVESLAERARLSALVMLRLAEQGRL